MSKINLFYKEFNITIDKNMAITTNSEVNLLGYMEAYDDMDDEYLWLVDNASVIKKFDPYFVITSISDKYEYDVTIYFSDGFIEYIDSINNALAVTKAIMLLYDKHKFCKLVEEVGI